MAWAYRSDAVCSTPGVFEVIEVARLCSAAKPITISTVWSCLLHPSTSGMAAPAATLKAEIGALEGRQKF